MLLGLVLWTFLEYNIHRFIFHMKTAGKNNFVKLFHFVLHGYHHKTPFDKYRLISPPSFGALVGLLFYTIFHYSFIWSDELFNDRIITCGFLIGYVTHDMIHYYLHCGDPDNKYFYYLKRYHFNHHFANHETGFGLTSIFWDKVFHTEHLLRDLKFRLSWSRPNEEVKSNRTNPTIEKND